MLRVETESGRVYDIDVESGFWWRLSKPHMKRGTTHRLWALMRGTHFDYPHKSPKDSWEQGDPVVGKHMYIASRDEWYVTSRVVSIEVLP